MRTIKIPYYTSSMDLHIEEENLEAVITAKTDEYKAELSEAALVEQALANPIGTPRLRELAKDKKTVVLVTSDHTRAVPSKLTLPILLREIREGNPDADITILIATGCHRETTRDELVSKFGEDIVAKEKIVVHDCDDTSCLTDIGTLPSGGRCVINRLAIEADLLVSEGFIEPHFFAGFSGGRKSVLPGIAARETVLANHCAEFIDSPLARTGNLTGNPIHEDMLWAAKQAKLSYIVNVVIDSDKKVIFATAGDMQQAHAAGCEFLSSLCRTAPVMSDIVITTNGGYPLDQNIYQSVKGMTAAEATVKEGGVIVMLSRADNGHGGEAFYHQLADEADLDKTMALFRSRGRNETKPDQWQSQIFIRVLKRARVVFVSDMDDETVRAMHMIPAHSLDEALSIADSLTSPDAKITVIPDGVSVIVG